MGFSWISIQPNRSHRNSYYSKKKLDTAQALLSINQRIMILTWFLAKNFATSSIRSTISVVSTNNGVISLAPLTPWSTNYQVLRPVKQQNAPPLTASDSNQVGTKKSAENGWLIKGNARQPPTPSSPAPSHTPRPTRPAHHALIHPPPPLLPKGERRSERNVRSSENNYDTRAKTSNEESIFCFLCLFLFHPHTCTHKHLYTHTHTWTLTHTHPHTQ